MYTEREKEGKKEIERGKEKGGLRECLYYVGNNLHICSCFLSLRIVETNSASLL